MSQGKEFIEIYISHNVKSLFSHLNALHKFADQ